jgi:hypothetical protein
MSVSNEQFSASSSVVVIDWLASYNAGSTLKWIFRHGWHAKMWNQLKSIDIKPELVLQVKTPTLFLVI